MNTNKTTNYFSLNQLFQSTQLYKEYKSNPLGFIDIGARGGPHEIILPFLSLSKIMSFEPDKTAATEIENKSWGDCKHIVEATVLGDRNGDLEFFITSNPAASSIFEPNLPVVERYKLKQNYPTGNSEILNCTTLDCLIDQKHNSEDNLGEIIKIDTQGSELSILKGSESVLRSNTVALFVEVEFIPVYQNQPFFSEVEMYLRELGFSFYGFDSLHFRSKKLINKKNAPFMKERVYWADAVFLKDPFDSDNVLLSKRNFKQLILIFSIRYLKINLAIKSKITFGAIVEYYCGIQNFIASIKIAN